MRTLAQLALLAVLAVASEARPADPAVRPLKFDRNVVPFELAQGEAGVTVLATPDEVKKHLGEKVAGELVQQVNLEKESIAVVRYRTSGPPYGTLHHQVKDRAIEFYVKAPKAGARGEALKLGFEPFAVPRGQTSRFLKGER